MSTTHQPNDPSANKIGKNSIREDKYLQPEKKPDIMDTQA